MKTAEVQPGDVIQTGFGINREPVVVIVHDVHRYDTGALSIRARFASNPRGVDWSMFIPVEEPMLDLVARGVARIDSHVRSLIPG